jgi:hypothetical protein
MDEAAEQVTPIEWWALDDLLEYLTLAPFRYEIDEALLKMERAISTGDLLLYFDTDAIDGKLQTYEFDPFRFHTAHTLKFDYFSQLVRVVPRRGLQVGRRGYKLIKQDAQRVWPLRPPASQTAPDKQPEDKAGPDPFRTGAAGRPSAAYLIEIEAKRRIAEKEVTLTLGGLTAFSEDLEKWWAEKRLTFDPPRPSDGGGEH